MPRSTSSSACSSFHSANRLSRRSALKVGGLGLLGLTMPRLLRAESWPTVTAPVIRPRAKSVIFLYQFGGPSHLDMFDMKPDAPEGIRGPHKPIPSSADGIQVSERLPRVAKIMDKVTLVRSMTHTMKNHNSASYYALSGHAPPVDDIRLKDTLDLFPAYGSVVDRLAPTTGEVPTSVSYPYVIRDGAVQWRPAVDVNRVVLGAQLVAIIALLTLRQYLKLRARRTSASAPMGTEPHGQDADASGAGGRMG